MEASVTVAILAFIGCSIPIVGGLWRTFAIKEKLQSDIRDNQHRIEKLEAHITHLHDQQELAINGMKEVLAHVRTRTQIDSEKLQTRLSAVEGFLTKTTQFNPRNHD